MPGADLPGAVSTHRDAAEIEAVWIPPMFGQHGIQGLKNVFL
jgi:hypothetical protein